MQNKTERSFAEEQHTHQLAQANEVRAKLRRLVRWSCVFNSKETSGIHKLSKRARMLPGWQATKSELGTIGSYTNRLDAVQAAMAEHYAKERVEIDSVELVIISD